MNVGIVGCGGIAPLHIQGWRRLKNVKIEAVCDINEERAASIATKWGIPKYYTSLDEMLAKTSISAVSILVPPKVHAELAIKAMENGCDVILEKPFAPTLKEADKIIKCYLRTQRKLTVVHNFRFFPAMIKALSLAQIGALGKISGVVVYHTLTKFDPMSKDPNHWSHKMKGGRLAETISHPLYLLTSFLNGMKVCDVSVSKVGEYPWMPVDQAIIVMSSVSGASGVIFIVGNAARDEAILEIFGSHKHLRVNIFRNLLTWNDRANYFSPSWRGGLLWKKCIANLRESLQSMTSTIKLIISSVSEEMDPHKIIIEKFRDSIIKDSPPPIDPLEAREVVRLSEEICERLAALIEKSF